MSTGTITALSIIVISILVLIIVIAKSYTNIKPTLANIKDLQENLAQKGNYFTREGKHLNEEVTNLSKRATLLQKDVKEKTVYFDDFMDEQGQFQTSLLYLKDHAGEYTKGITTNVKNEIQEDGPKIVDTFKRAFKKTYQKQKLRYQK